MLVLFTRKLGVPRSCSFEEAPRCQVDHFGAKFGSSSERPTRSKDLTSKIGPREDHQVHWGRFAVKKKHGDRKTGSKLCLLEGTLCWGVLNWKTKGKTHFGGPKPILRSNPCGEEPPVRAKAQGCGADPFSASSLPKGLGDEQAIPGPRFQHRDSQLSVRSASL